MALITFLLIAAWTVLVMRLFLIGATLSERTYLTYIGLGALMAVTAAPLAEKVIFPYPLHEYGYGYLGILLRLLVRDAVLLAPVATLLLLHRRYRLIGVADAFGLAFAVGFGFEFVGAVLASSAAPMSFSGMTLFPPWQFTSTGDQRFAILGLLANYAIPGIAYSIALASIIAVSLLRCGVPWQKTLASSAAVLLLATAHEALWVQQIAGAGAQRPSAWVGWSFDQLMFHGQLLAPAALAALIYFSLREARWVATISGIKPSPPSKLLGKGQNLFTALFRNGLRGYLAASETMRREHQLQIVKAELARAPDDRELFQSAELLEIRLGRLSNQEAIADQDAGVAAIDARVVQCAAAALALIIVLMAWLPDWLSPYLWKFPLLNIDIPVFNFTIAQAALVAVLLWWFIQGPAEPPASWDPDVVANHYGENAISFAALGAALLVYFHVQLQSFYPPYSTFAFLNRSNFPAYDPAQFAALLLLMALVVSGLRLRSSARWKSETSLDDQRAAVVPRAILAGNAMILMWFSVRAYPSVLGPLQSNLGPGSFNIFGRFGNVVVALLAALIVFGLSLGAGYALRLLSQRVEKFLIGGSTA